MVLTEQQQDAIARALSPLHFTQRELFMAQLNRWLNGRDSVGDGRTAQDACVVAARAFPLSRQDPLPGVTQ
jgi:hypothetical protein